MRARLKKPELSVVLPCFNEGPGLEMLLKGYAAAAPRRLAWELILVDNGSQDATPQLLEALLKRREFKFARALSLEANAGYGGGILAGLKAARGTWLAWSHADGQCEPKAMFKVYAFRSRTALVKGWRAGRSSFLTRMMTAWVRLWLGGSQRDINAQPKLFHRALLPRLEGAPAGFEFDLHVLHMARRAGLDLAEIPVSFGKRGQGVSKWSAGLGSRLRTVGASAWHVVKLKLQRGE